MLMMSKVKGSLSAATLTAAEIAGRSTVNRLFSWSTSRLRCPPACATLYASHAGRAAVHPQSPSMMVASHDSEEVGVHVDRPAVSKQWSLIVVAVRDQSHGPCHLPAQDMNHVMSLFCVRWMSFPILIDPIAFPTREAESPMQ
jgi:hypothetical protein